MKRKIGICFLLMTITMVCTAQPETRYRRNFKSAAWLNTGGACIDVAADNVLIIAARSNHSPAANNAGRKQVAPTTKSGVNNEVSRMNKLVDDQQRRLQVQRYLSFLQISILLLVVVLCAGIWRSNRQRKRANVQLRKQKDEQEAFIRKLNANNEELNVLNDELNRYKSGLEAMVAEKTFELRQALERAQESDRLKAAFFANMSHEIRTPFNAILGFLQVIFSPGFSNEEYEQMVSLIKANADQLLTLVNDIVDLSQIDADQLSIHPKPCRIDQLLDETYDLTRKMISYSGKKPELVCENQLTPGHVCMIDGKRVQQVLLRLLDNAVKFTDRGYIRFGCCLSDADDLLHFYVEDSGIGIPSEYHKDVFSRFWKYSDVTKQCYRGTGIGLPLCKHLVDLMGGHFEMESIPGTGSTFCFSVRIHDASLNP